MLCNINVTKGISHISICNFPLDIGVLLSVQTVLDYLDSICTHCKHLW